MSAQERFITAEAVVLERDVAGLGSRFIGALVDSVLQIGATLIASLAGVEIGGDAEVVVPVLVGFLAIFVYPTVAETLSRGRTLGKLAARTRVVRTDGRPVTFGVVLVRNLLRLVDLLPGFYSIGAISILLTRRAQRLGDLAAGTLVLYDAPVQAPRPLHIEPTDEVRVAGHGLDTAGLGADDYQLVRSFLARRHDLVPEARKRLAEQLADALRERVGAPADTDPEVFLEALVAATRDRPES